MSYEQGKSLLDVMILTNRMSIDCFMNKQIADNNGLTADLPFDQKLKAMKDQRSPARDPVRSPICSCWPMRSERV